MPNGVDAELFSPGRRRGGPARAARDPGRRARRRVRRHARPRPPLQAPRRRDRRARASSATSASTSSSPAAASCSRASATARATAGVARPRPLPRRGPARRAARRPARRRPLPAHDRAAGVVRDRPDRGDGLRAAGDRHRLPRRARGRRRRRHRAAGPARRPGAVAAALGELVAAGPSAGARSASAGRAKAVREWSWPTLVERMDGAYAEAIAARRRGGA